MNEEKKRKRDYKSENKNVLSVRLSQEAESALIFLMSRGLTARDVIEDTLIDAYNHAISCSNREGE